MKNINFVRLREGIKAMKLENLITSKRREWLLIAFFPRMKEFQMKS
jgi:hypothetical protein